MKVIGKQTSFVGYGKYARNTHIFILASVAGGVTVIRIGRVCNQGAKIETCF